MLWRVDIGLYMSKQLLGGGVEVFSIRDGEVSVLSTVRR